jgi:HlyD family secretion protein
MHNRRPPIPVIIVFLLIIAAAAYYFYATRQAKADSVLQASGSIEAVDVRISPELSGKVAQVLVGEGDVVEAGDELIRLDDALLKAQHDLAAANVDSAKGAVTTAEAALASAQAQYTLALNSALAEEQAVRAAAWQHSRPGEFDQPLWYFSRSEQLIAAHSEVVSAAAALRANQDDVEAAESSTGAADFVSAETRLLGARAGFLAAQDVFDRAESAVDASDLRHAAQTALDDATTELEDAQNNYDDALSTDGAEDVLTARADLAVAQERYDTAQDRLRALETGADSPRVTAAERAVEQAQAVAAQAQLNAQQAQASLELLEVQMDKLTVVAPADGVVLSRSVEPGEVVSPGASALTLGLLDDLTITVYVPEDRYGEINLGQKADVTVDSFPDETFSAVVTHIADQAEFTPRNVQTAEGRATTVYAIELRVQDPEGRLKPGMPADVTFR